LLAKNKSGFLKSTTGYIVEIIEIIIVVFALSWYIKAYVFHFTKINESGMLPALTKNNHVFVEKLLKDQILARGDVVVLYGVDSKAESVRRLIGLAGEKIEIRNGFIYVNNEPLYEPYGYTPVTCDFAPVIVPQDHIFVLNDNRSDYNDSRTWGSIPKEKIIGEAQFCYWPWSQIKFL